MILNPHGWRQRYNAAKERSAAVAARREVNAKRWAHYQTQKVGTTEPEPEPIVEQAVEKIDDPVSADDMTNAEIRYALEGVGLEVPKNTARARLIELYEEHVEKRDD